MIGGQVVVVEYPDPEHREEGAAGHVGDGEEADHLYPPVVIVTGRKLDEDGVQRQGGEGKGECDLRPGEHH